MSENEAFEKKCWETRAVTGCNCQLCHDRELAIWRAGVEHMRSSTRGLYCKCPGCGEFLAIPIKPHYCNVGLHVSSAFTRADILALAETKKEEIMIDERTEMEVWLNSKEGLHQLRETVALEMLGWRKVIDRGDATYRKTSDGGYVMDYQFFKPDRFWSSLGRVIKVAQEKGFVCSFGYTIATDTSWARFWNETEESLEAYSADLKGKNRVKEAITIAALRAVRGL